MATTRVNEWKLGLFVVAAVGIGIAGLVWLGANRVRRESREVVSYFDESVDGLDLGAPVKYLGVTIGRVKDISLATDPRYVEVVTQLYVDELERLNLSTSLTSTTEGTDHGLRVQIVSSVLTGVSFLEGSIFDPHQYPPPDYPFDTPRNTIHTVPSTMKSLETGLVEAMNSIPEVVEQTAKILARFESAMDDVQFREISAQAVELMSSLQRRLDTLEELPVLTEGRSAMQEARAALAEFRGAIGRLGGEQGSLERTLAGYDAVALDLRTTLREADLPGTAASVRTMGDEASEVADEVGRLSEELRLELVHVREALDSLRALADALRRDPGALLHGRTPQARPDRD